MSYMVYRLIVHGLAHALLFWRAENDKQASIVTQKRRGEKNG